MVRGALMKGLAKAAPRLERVKILSRSARKHYGSESRTTFDASLGHLESHKYVSNCILVGRSDTLADPGIHTVLSM